MADLPMYLLGALIGFALPLPSTIFWCRSRVTLPWMREEPPRDRYFLRVNGRDIEVV